ncbi:hypothetical protein C8R43DRAFT_1087891 [Mycena crocata]|nr:hypothetical protein C8R43DRAFT_1087891 [Mycena crocata]
MAGARNPNSHRRGGRGGRGGAPILYEHRPDTAGVVRLSNDARRAYESMAPVQRPTVPEHYSEDIGTNAGVDGPDFGYEMGEGLPDLDEVPVMDGILVKVKAKRYKNSDEPFKTWVVNRDEYLDETLRQEGRGSRAVYSTCGACGLANPAYRCEHQACYGPEMFCQACVVNRHEVLPTHWIQEWSGSHFKRVGLAKLGLVIQLGHTPGSSCDTMRRARTKFTLIDVSGIHNVNVQFCECDSEISHRQQLMRVHWWPATVVDPATCATTSVIRLFHNLNCLGKISAFHFLRSLELLTNKDGLTPPPNRRRAFMYIVRQYIMTQPMKRAGRGHTDSGVEGTTQGELAPLCRGCPQFGKNCGEHCATIDWSTMPEDLSYKYFTFLAQDCNFRLINRDISTEARDPVVDDGRGFFVNRVEYKEFLRKHVDEEEISTCSGFQAMFLANTKRIKGLRTTGVGGVTCARHNMWRPNGIGDLQAGERYCNMDFILFSAVLNCIITWLILSKNFWSRMKDLPEKMHLDPKKTKVWFKVPNFHILGHKWKCHSPFSFHFTWGVGVTDGEDVEQNWEFTNGAAGSTKMMGLGTRHAFLEALFGFHNWMRTVSYRRVFPRRLARDLKEGQRDKEAFDSFTELVEAERPELVEKWRTWVKEWESEQHDEQTVDSPYEMPHQVHTMKKVQLELEKAELSSTADGLETIERAHTASGFIAMGLDVEQSQYVGISQCQIILTSPRRILAIDIKALTDPSPLQELAMVKRKTALTRRIKRFRKLQRTYMPRVERHLLPSQRAIFEDKAQSPESMKLFLPSELTGAGRAAACEKGLVKTEEMMREAELKESLDDLRTGLRVRTMTARFRLRNSTGQRALTRGQGILRLINIRIHKAKLRYRYSRNQFLRLKGHGGWEKEYRILLDEHGGVQAAGVVAAGETLHQMSWIWYKTGLTGEDADLVDALRVEWCKAYSRTRRWHEDIVLVEEEMERTIEFGAWSAATWRVRATARTRNMTPELAEGLQAYAMEHVEREERTCVKLAGDWRGLRQRGRDYLAGIPAEHGERLVVELGDEEQESDDEGDLAGDEEVDGLGENEVDEVDEDD